MSILKPPPKQPKALTIQARVEESVKTQLELYAEFIDASTSYVITEALRKCTGRAKLRRISKTA